MHCVWLSAVAFSISIPKTHRNGVTCKDMRSICFTVQALLSHEDLVKFRTRFCERFLQYGECNFGDK